MKLGKKIGGVAAALALATGAMVSPAQAIETGQMLDKGPKWPHKSSHFVQLGLGIAALVAAIVLLSGGKDKPASP